MLKALTHTGNLIVPDFTLEIITEDPPDNRILECAVAGNANLIVSGNRHLLRLREYEGIAIVRPRDFMRMLVWLVVEVAQHYRLLRGIAVYRDLYEVVQEFGITFNY
jgi:hypothetical protein